jgi:mycothiol synthase
LTTREGDRAGDGVSSAIRTFQPEDEAAIRRIMTDSLAVDRLPGFRESEFPRSLSRIAADPGRTAVATDGGRVVGYCTPLLDDLRVHPDARRRGHGRRLVAAAREIQRARGRDLILYVPTHLPGSVAFAGSVGLRYHSSQWQFILPAGTEVPTPTFGSDVVACVIDPRDIEDLDRWVTFLLASFEGHPSPMSWTADGLRRLHASPGFDGSGVLVVAPADAVDDYIAFARVESYIEDGAAAGEIGLLGVVPAWRRRGLGRELLRWGVTELRGRGVGQIELTVEAANDGATRLYRDHGFEPTVEWPHWLLPAD